MKNAQEFEAGPQHSDLCCVRAGAVKLLLAGSAALFPSSFIALLLKLASHIDYIDPPALLSEGHSKKKLLTAALH